MQVKKIEGKSYKPDFEQAYQYASILARFPLLLLIFAGNLEKN